MAWQDSNPDHSVQCLTHSLQRVYVFFFVFCPSSPAPPCFLAASTHRTQTYKACYNKGVESPLQAMFYVTPTSMQGELRETEFLS